MERNKKAFTGDGNLIIYKILFHQDIFSYPHNDRIFIHWMFMIVPAKIQRAFEECLKWLRKPHLSSSVTWCRYQIVATNSHSSSTKDGWTKLYFVTMPVKSLSIALTILHWSWYRWESASSHHPTHTWGQCWHTKPGLVLLEGHKFVTVSAVAVRVSLSPLLVAPTVNLVQGWSPFAATTTQVPHHQPAPAAITLVPFPHSPVTGQKRFLSCHIHQQHQGHTANTTLNIFQ